MNTVLLEKPTGPLADKQLPAARLAPLRSWLLSWEIHLILPVAAFLRLYGVNRSEFDTDQANFFQMARYAVTHGLLPATANIASVGIYTPPFKQDSLFTGSQRSTSSTVSMSGQFYQTNPYYLYWKPFTFLTFATTTTQKQTQQTPEHKDYLTAQVPIVPSVLRLSTKRAKKLGG